MKSFVFLIIFSLSSCTLYKRSSDMDTISIGDGQDRGLTIDSESSDDYGPSSGDSAQIAEAGEQKIINSLTVYSTLYSSLGMVDLLAQAEKKKILFSLIAANGFASLISVLYAKEKSSNYLEWKLFDLLKRLKSKTPFTNDWEETIRAFLKKEFGEMQLQQLKVLVLIPEKVGHEIRLSSTGSVVEKVMASLSLKNKKSFYLNAKKIDVELASFGIDLNLSVAYLPKKPSFKNLTGYQWGLFTTYLSFIDRNEQLYRAINTNDEQVVDEVSPLSDLKNAYYDSISEVLDDYIQEIEQWKIENSTSSPSKI